MTQRNQDDRNPVHSTTNDRLQDKSAQVEKETRADGNRTGQTPNPRDSRSSGPQETKDPRRDSRREASQAGQADGAKEQRDTSGERKSKGSPDGGTIHYGDTEPNDPREVEIEAESDSGTH